MVFRINITGIGKGDGRFIDATVPCDEVGIIDIVPPTKG